MDWQNKHVAVAGSRFTVTLAPGAGATMTIAMKRYAERPTVRFPSGVARP